MHLLEGDRYPLTLIFYALMNSDRLIVNESYVMGKSSGIISVRFHEKVIYDFRIAERVHNDIELLAGNQQELLLTDLSNIRYWTVAAQLFRESFGKLPVQAEALILSRNHAGNIWEGFFRRFNNLSHPYNFCRTEEEAILWLQKFVKLRRK